MPVGHDVQEFGASLPMGHRGQDASDLIRAKLSDPAPCMITRFGNIELRTVINHWHQIRHGFAKNAWLYIRGRQRAFWWDMETKNQMRQNAGFFPCTDEALARFAELYLRDIEQIDVLGSWLRDEAELGEQLGKATMVPLPDLEPYYHETPWTRALEGRSVLVIHPFEQSIRQQYKKRTELFSNPEMLPSFDLKTIKAVQSLGGECHGYNSWFEALDQMCGKVDETEFDIALIGAGAYGLPLAAHIKRLGKKAVHLGGATQILFGIKGKRWDEFPPVRKLYNEHWSRPLQEETPSGYKAVESGCYW